MWIDASPVIEMPPPAERWGAVVIGAGPAGSLSALLLARRGIHTLLVERQTFPRRKVCGCCLNAGALSLLRDEGLDFPASLPRAPVLKRATFCFAGSTLDLPLPGGAAIGRDELDTWLAGEAVAEGAELIEGTIASVGKWERDGRGVSLRDSAGRTRHLAARVVIIAGGLGFQPAIDGLAWKTPRWFTNRIGMGGVLPPGSPGPPPGVVELHFRRGGYVGLVRLGDGSVDAAAAIAKPLVQKAGSAGAALAALCHDPPSDLTGALRSASWKGTPPLTRRATRVWAPGVFLVGDAAGYAEPFSGEGMRWALLSAASLAPIAACAAREGWRPDLGRRWQGDWGRSVGRNLLKCGLTARMLRGVGNGHIVRGALRIPHLRGALVRRFT